MSDEEPQMASTHQFRYLLLHFYFGILISIIVPFILSHGILTLSCLIICQFFLFVICHWNDPVPDWLGVWNHWGAKIVGFLFIVAVPHIVVWIVMAGLELTLKQVVYWLEYRRLALSFVSLFLIPFIPSVIVTVLALCSFEKVLSLRSL